MLGVTIEEEEKHERTMIGQRDVLDRTIIAMLTSEYAQDIYNEWKRVQECHKWHPPYIVQVLRDLPDPTGPMLSALVGLLAVVMNKTTITKAAAASLAGGIITKEVSLALWEQANPKHAGISKVIGNRLSQDHHAVTSGGVLTEIQKAWRIQSNVAKRFAWDAEPVKKSKRMAIGAQLVDIIQWVTPIFGFFKKLKTMSPTGPRFIWMVGLSSHTLDWINKAQLRMGDHYVMKPMLRVPRKWAEWDGGGYELLSRPFMKSRRKPAPVGNRMRAVNALQGAAFEIHPWIYQLVTDMRKQEHKLAPRVLEYIAPPRPPEGASKDEMKDWSNARFEARQRAAQSIQERGRFDRTLDAAEEHLGKPIWYPHQCDSRARIYPMATVLNPQGESLEKALLMAHKGLPIGTRGAYWLATHVAGVWGMDKYPWNERAEWTQNHTDWIIDVAINPWPHLEQIFAEADDPWAFLAACHEWLGFIEQGHEFITRLPVTQDATCSGFQHQAGLMLDPHTAAYVNLRGGPRQDVYKTVADTAVGILTLDDHEYAAKWLLVGVDRPLAKRPTMIQPYAGTRMAMGDYSCAEYIRRYNAGLTDVTFGSEKHHHHKAGIYMGRVWWDAIQRVVPGGSAYMKWASEIGKLVAKQGKHLQWYVPDDPDYPTCSHSYTKPTQRVVSTYLCGRRNKIRYREYSDEPHVAKSKQAAAPNIIHYLDSHQLSMAILRNKRDGVDFQTVVHDQHGVLAPHVDTMRKNLLSSYHDMYRTDNQEPLIHRLHQGITELTGCDDLPEPPTLGAWDPAEVLEATFAYS